MKMPRSLTALMAILLILALLALAGYALDTIAIHGWAGCAYRLDCCPASGEGLCYLEEGRVHAARFPACPSGLAPRSLGLECGE